MNTALSHIILKPIAESDLDLYVSISTCAEIMRYVYDPMTEQQAEQAFAERLLPWQYESDTWLSFTIFDSKRELKLGSIGLKIIDHQARIAEVGFMLLPAEQGKGYASAALAQIHQLAFEQMSINELAAICDVRNKSSMSLLQKHGYTQLKRLENNSEIAGELVDDFRYQLTLNDYLSRVK